jgi:hypothetical protein
MHMEKCRKGKKLNNVGGVFMITGTSTEEVLTLYGISQSEYDKKKANGEDMSKYCIVQCEPLLFTYGTKITTTTCSAKLED